MRLGIFIFVLFLSGCANLEAIDRSRLNHPAMNFADSFTPSQSASLTNINSLQNSNTGGACTTCAH